MRSKTHATFIIVLSFAGMLLLSHAVDCMKSDFLENNCPKVCNPDGGRGDAEKG